MRTTLLIISLLSLSAAAHETVRWPTNESRIDADMSGTEAIPPPIVFQSEVPRAKPTTFEENRGQSYVNSAPYVGYGYLYNNFTGFGGYAPTPQIRSNALTNPQGMPGGSRPGLLP